MVLWWVVAAGLRWRRLAPEAAGRSRCTAHVSRLHQLVGILRRTYPKDTRPAHDANHAASHAATVLGHLRGNRNPQAMIEEQIELTEFVMQKGIRE